MANPLSRENERHPILNVHVSINETTDVRTLKWKEIAGMLAGGVIEIAKALNRIADQLERSTP